MTINREGLELVRIFEGLELKPYLCPAGIWTQGYGRTKGITQHSPAISRKQADEWLLEDLAAAEKAVDLNVYANLNDNQLSALISFVFNIGATAFARSTLLRRLNEENYIGAAAQFERWVYGGGKRLPGLARRKAAERALFLKSVAKEGAA